MLAVLLGGAALFGASAARALPPGYSYEMVSPPEKHGAGVIRSYTHARAAADGQSVAYLALGALDDAEGAPTYPTWFSSRGAQSWGTRSIDPLQGTHPVSALGAGVIYRTFTEDLSKGVLIHYGEPLTPDGETNVFGLYLADMGAGTLRLVSKSASPLLADGFTQSLFADATPDFEHIFFSSPYNLTSDAVGSALKAYEYEDGEVRLVGILPSGEVPATGSAPGVDISVKSTDAGRYTENTISTDGERLLFTAPPTALGGRLYLREANGTLEARTIMVQKSEATTPDATVRPAQFQAASEEVNRVHFTTSEKLLDADLNPSGTAATSRDLYMYTHGANPDAEANLTLISEDKEPEDGVAPSVQGVLGASADGQTVYFSANGQIVAGEDITAGVKIYVWDRGTVRYIARNPGGSVNTHNWSIQAATPKTARVTASGNRMMMLWKDADSLENQAHVYDLETSQLRCASCPGKSLASPDAFFTSEPPLPTNGRYLPRNLSADGRFAFFNTASPLVAADTNGAVDVYRYDWEADSVALISPGRGSGHGYFIDASADGSTVFFTTRSRISGWDFDDNPDLYAARIGVGMPEPPAVFPECQGEGCQGLAIAPPAEVSTASNRVSGPGNPVPKRKSARKRCRAVKKGSAARGKRPCLTKKKGKGKSIPRPAKKTAGASK